MVNMFEAKTDLSKLVKKLEDKEEDLIVICRAGKPVAHLTLPRRKPRFGSQDPQWMLREESYAYGEALPDSSETNGLPYPPYVGDFDEQNGEIAELFGL
jgi:antitoxin (DNA-binding transcriptional repressor) of toxin-antitoxin stability system